MVRATRKRQFRAPLSKQKRKRRRRRLVRTITIRLRPRRCYYAGDDGGKR